MGWHFLSPIYCSIFPLWTFSKISRRSTKRRPLKNSTFNTIWKPIEVYHLNPNNAAMQFPVPGMPASRWQGFPRLWLVFLCQRDAGKVFPASGWYFRPARRWQGFPRLWLVFYASETLARFSPPLAGFLGQRDAGRPFR